MPSAGERPVFFAEATSSSPVGTRDSGLIEVQGAPNEAGEAHFSNEEAGFYLGLYDFKADDNGDSGSVLVEVQLTDKVTGNPASITRRWLECRLPILPD